MGIVLTFINELNTHKKNESPQFMRNSERERGRVWMIERFTWIIVKDVDLLHEFQSGIWTKSLFYKKKVDFFSNNDENDWNWTNSLTLSLSLPF